MYGSGGGKKKNHHQTRFSGIIIKEASPGPPSPVSPRTSYRKHPSCVSLQGRRSCGRVPRARPAPGRGLISDRRTDSPQLPASARRPPPRPHPSAARGPLPGRQIGLRRNWFQLEFLLCTCIPPPPLSLQLAPHGLGILAGQGRGAESVNRSAETQQNGCG